jgi:hypothetical protein
MMPFLFCSPNRAPGLVDRVRPCGPAAPPQEAITAAGSGEPRDTRLLGGLQKDIPGSWVTVPEHRQPWRHRAVAAPPCPSGFLSRPEGARKLGLTVKAYARCPWCSPPTPR